jgi:hypothetical protein
MSEIISEKAIVLSSADILSNYQIEQNKNIVVGNNCVQTGEKPYIEWYYDQSGIYWYVFINGDINLRDYVVRILKEHNIQSIKTGKSYKAAGNGKKYDWFLRVFYFENNSGINAGIPPSRELVYEVFNKYFTLYKDKFMELEFKYHELELKIKSSREENARLNNKINKLKNDLFYKEARLSSFINRYKILEDNSIRNSRIQIFENHKLQNTIKAINEELSFYKNNLNQDNDLNQEIDKKKQEISNWVKELNDLEQKYQELGIEKVKVENEKERIIHENNMLIEKINQIEFSSNGSFRNRKYINANNVFENENALRILLENLFENLIISKSSASYLYNEVQNPLPAIEILKKLNYYPEKVGSKIVKCTKDWREVPFKVGDNGNTGRLYFAKISSGGAKYMVRISDKDTQKIDFDILKKIKIS